jgi:hypothetical protein
MAITCRLLPGVWAGQEGLDRGRSPPIARPGWRGGSKGPQFDGSAVRPSSPLLLQRLHVLSYATVRVEYAKAQSGWFLAMLCFPVLNSGLSLFYLTRYPQSLPCPRGQKPAELHAAVRSPPFSLCVRPVWFLGVTTHQQHLCTKHSPISASIGTPPNIRSPSERRCLHQLAFPPSPLTYSPLIYTYSVV